MRINKKILIIVLLAFLMLTLMPRQGVEASGLVAISKSSGGNLTYRGSSEVVYRLEEYNYPTNQLRAVWVSPFVGDISSYSSESQFKSDITYLLDDLVSMGMNAIVYHVRTHNNAMYKSELNPLASWWANVNFDTFDPLKYVIDECHARGIEFHAWMNPYRVSTNGTTSHYVSGGIPAVNPVNNPDNLIQVNKSIILDPGIPEVRDFLVDTCMEVIENYDVDAIHFDDYFYISGADDTETRQKYNTENLSLGDFRRKQVDLFIEDLSKNIRKYNEQNDKCVQLGISPSNVYKNGGYVSSPKYDANGNLISPTYSNTGGFAHYDNYLYSDTLNWINNEWIDYIMPQCYHALENTAAPFADVVRWWSWAVRNKKVNFYAGLGIYMTLESGASYATWKVNENEIELQLLYAGQFAEFGGANFYKYSSLKRTSNAVVADAVDTISNDFWKVRIPSAVNKYYAPIMGEVKPTNVSYDSDTKLLTFDAIDNVRGYMVYKVPKGSTLDKNNINHIYSYTQSTSITIDDTSNYDYYVASVNLANETSEATFVTIALNAIDVINAINALPTTITIDAKEQIEQTRFLYNSLSNTEQAKVTNLDKLIAAENALNSIDSVAEKLDDYISTLDLHIKESRTIPLLANMTISYKNTSDSTLYNITTGEKLKNYLATKLITLVISLTENGITATREVEFNIGYTPTNMKGLFYRNDPSSVGEDDEGLYTPGGSGWIGWSGHTVVVDNYILYIADQNYHEITNASDISKCKWTSVAGVYVNKTSSTVTMKMTDAFDSYSSGNDGYFIISKDQIKSTYHGFNSDVTISLESGEALVIVKFLDADMDEAPLAPVTKITEGTKAYVDNEMPKSNEDTAKEIMDLIDTIPDSVTLNDENLVNSINEKYLELSDEVKVLVTNYNLLENALITIEALKNEISTAKQNAIDELNAYLDLNNYSEEAKTKINTYLINAKTSINNATTKENIQTIVQETKTLLDGVLTIAEELTIYKEEQTEALEESVDLTLYSKNNQAKLQEYLEDAKSSINAASTKDEVDLAISQAKVRIAGVKTLEDEEKELDETRQNYINMLEEYIVKYDTTDDIKTELRKYKTTYISQINNATEGFEDIYNSFKATITVYFEELSSLRTEKIEEIEAYLSTLKYTEKEIIAINAMKEEEINVINNIVSLDAFEDIVDSFIEKVETYHNGLVLYRHDAIDSLSKYLLPEYTEKQVEQISNMIEVASEEITLSGNKSEIDNIVLELEETIETYITTLTQAINEAKSYFDSKNISNNEEITNLITSSKENVNQAGTLEEVNLIKASFDKSYQAIVSKPEILEIIALAKAEIEEYISNLTYDSVEINVIKEMKIIVFTNLENATSEEVVNAIKQQFMIDVENYHETLNEAKNDAKSIVSGKTAITNSAQTLITTTLSKIEKASQVEEVTSIMNDFNTKFAALNVEAESCNCSGLATVFGTISISLGLLALVLKKKK